MNNQYYLNNSGSRWINRPEQSQWFSIWQGKDRPSIVVKRKAKYWYQLGNFAGVVISYKGRAVRALPSEAPENEK